MNNVVALSWYMCGIFFLGTFLCSLVTVVPEVRNGVDMARNSVDMAALFCLVASALFAGLALFCTAKYSRPNIDPPRWLLRCLQACAILMTPLVLLSFG